MPRWPVSIGTSISMEQQLTPARILRNIFRAAKWRIILTFALLNLENLLRLCQPFVLGWAIDDLLKSSYSGLMAFMAQHVAHLLIGLWRQMYDTRVFTSLYTDLATSTVVSQRSQNVEVSRVAARSSLSREFVEFFERYVPMVVRSLYACIGALVMMMVYDLMLVPVCLLLLVPVFLLNQRYARKTLSASRQLHDDLEREVEVIEASQSEQVRSHFDQVARSRIRLSDLEAANFGITEIFVLGLLIVSLIRICRLPGIEPGDLFAVFRYLMMFIMGLDSVPSLMQQLSRLKDIGRRLAVP